MIGKTLGHYEIIATLGAGGMGEVYRAQDTKLGREIALKLLPAELAQEPERLARFKREATSLAALSHPNIVVLHSVEEADGFHFLTMELVKGQTLSERIPAGGMGLEQLLDLAIPLSDALATAHAQGITHRDLKPSNVMVDAQGRVKVLDFGLAKPVQAPSAHDDTLAVDITGEGRVLGTASYMSPEQAEGREVDARSDVFTLGILLYQMATGQKPFAGDTPMSTLTSIIRDDPPPVMELKPDLPPQIGRIIRRCLEKNPDRRYDTAKGLKFELESLREDSTEYRAASAAQIPKWPFVLGAVVIVGLVAILLFREGERRGDTVPEPPTPATVEAKTIVVFPFENLGNADDEYFAAGMTDEITARLGAVRGLRVLSRTSSQQYDRTGKTMQQIAADLGVDFVLEGAVRWQKSDTAASRVRVTPQLVRASDGTQVWAEVFDRTMEQVFAVQSEIAGEVIQRLGGTLALGSPESPDEQPTDNITAYHAYLRSRELLARSSYDPQKWTTAIELLERAVALDPQFAEAYASLAKAHVAFCHFNWDPSEERLAQSKAAADRALALGPELAESHIAMGYYYYWGLKDYAPALAEFEHAAANQPNDTEIMNAIAFIRRRQGRFSEAAQDFQRVTELDPENAGAYYDLCETLGVLGRYEEALRAGERAIQIGPDQDGNYQVTSEIAMLMGRADYAAQIVESFPGSPSTLTQITLFWAEYHTRDYAAALRVARELPALEREQFQMISRPFSEGLVHRAMGRDELALASFTEARGLFEEELRVSEPNSVLVSTLGVILAALGEGAAGVTKAESALTLFPADRDRWIRQRVLANIATAQAFAGQVDAAVASLDELLSEPTNALSVSLIRSSPAFDNLRESDEFARMLEARSQAN